MPWYKFTSIHGPGHQGHDEGYRFYDHRLSKEELREEWDDWCYHGGWSDSIGDAVEKQGRVGARERKAFREAFGRADEFKAGERYARCWYD
jgi:hypothetical protein